MVLAFPLFCLFSINIAKRLGRNTNGEQKFQAEPVEVSCQKNKSYFSLSHLDIGYFFQALLKIEMFQY